MPIGAMPAMFPEPTRPTQVTQFESQLAPHPIPDPRSPMPYPSPANGWFISWHIDMSHSHRDSVESANNTINVQASESDLANCDLGMPIRPATTGSRWYQDLIIVSRSSLNTSDAGKIYRSPSDDDDRSPILRQSHLILP